MALTAPNVICVTGGRDYTDVVTLVTTLELVQPTALVVGDARGVDTFARTWAESKGIPVAVLPANWKFFGKSAGMRRNTAMASMVNALGGQVICFPGGRGTSHMVETCERKGIPVTGCDLILEEAGLDPAKISSIPD